MRRGSTRGRERLCCLHTAVLRKKTMLWILWRKRGTVARDCFRLVRCLYVSGANARGFPPSNVVVRFLERQRRRGKNRPAARGKSAFSRLLWTNSTICKAGNRPGESFLKQKSPLKLRADSATGGQCFSWKKIDSCRRNDRSPHKNHTKLYLFHWRNSRRLAGQQRAGVGNRRFLVFSAPRFATL